MKYNDKKSYICNVLSYVVVVVVVVVVVMY